MIADNLVSTLLLIYHENTAQSAVIKPREIFESAAKRHFQKFLSTPYCIA